MLKKTHKVLDIFVRNPTITYLFNEIKSHTKSRSESYTYNSLNSFVREGVLTREKKGGLVIYQAAKNPKAISFLSMAAEFQAWNKKRFPLDVINELIKKININFFVLMVAGSYAKGKQTAGSDLDIILIAPKDAKKTSAALKHFCEMCIPPIHLYVFTDDEFKQMLLDEKHNFGKEAVKNNLIFYGAEAYYKLLFEAVKNGFSY